MNRPVTKQIKIGDVVIGGGAKVAIQSMTNTNTADAEATLSQIRRLSDAGCEIVRCTCPDADAATALKRIVKKSPLPVVADIHFDYKMAIAAIEAGVHKIRINPGNIGGRENIREVVKAALSRGIPIRVGVNAGSLEKEILARDHGVTAKGLVESALDKVRMLEENDFTDIVVSIKSSDVPLAIAAHRLLAAQCAYPLHIGITEAGTVRTGTVRSAVGLGILLYEGIGDTIRVSLSGDPVEEIFVAKQILRSLGLRKEGIDVVACPTCGRTKIDLSGLALRVEEMAATFPDLNLKVAVMGCVVNGPGEAKEADLGICGGNGEGLIIRKGEIIKKVPEEALLSSLQEELNRMSAASFQTE